MTNWTTQRIRDAFLEFWQKREHRLVASSSLVPANDATLLFTNAGMVQFKDLFLGLETRDYRRAVSAQRCVRAGGKHNDLENVGFTARHHTFFEMLGNFSFGDYFKQEAINNAWSLLTEVYGLPQEKLWVTVYHNDEEAYAIWADEIGVPTSRIIRIGDKDGIAFNSDNFWQMGDTGPCGPCTEIFYDHGEAIWGGPPGSADEDGDRYIEIWNLVFMQYERAADGSMTPLPAPCVDTGMGLERLAAVLQNVHSNYEIDLFDHLIRAASTLTDTADQQHNSLKVIADHIRSCAFMIVDGVNPGNSGRDYVLRRIIRRAVRQGFKLGMTTPFFHKMVAPLVAQMGAHYSALTQMEEKIVSTLKREEERFILTLGSGMEILDSATESLAAGETIDAALSFKLYATFGFPFDLTADIARERNLLVDEAGFTVLRDQHLLVSAAGSKFSVDLSGRISGAATQFVGYLEHSAQAHVSAIYDRQGQAKEVAQSGDTAVVILNTSPFYAESGGQVGDTGLLVNNETQLSVLDTTKQGSTWTHHVEVIAGQVSKGDSLQCLVDMPRRQKIILNHSATHLLHYALRKVLGPHVQQRGSLVNAEYLRFDFSQEEPISADQLQAVEYLVNAEIRANYVARIEEMPLEAAKSAGAIALFGEKYADIVRVVNLGPNSTELCGGIHVGATGEIGVFKISAESSVASGIRRIEAFSGDAAVEFIAEQQRILDGLSRDLKTPMRQLNEKVKQIVDSNKVLQSKIDVLNKNAAIGQLDHHIQSAESIGEIKFLTVFLEHVERKSLRDLADKIKSSLTQCVFLLAVVDDGKVGLLAGVSKGLTSKINAGEIVNVAAQLVGGKGGGRPELAQAGGDLPEAIPQALEAVSEFVKGKLA